MSKARDTQFAGFAKLLLEELPEYPIDDSITGIATAEWREAAVQIIARRAYDFANHVMDCTTAGFYASHYLAEGEAMADVTDMTAWPDREMDAELPG